MMPVTLCTAIIRLSLSYKVPRSIARRSAAHNIYYRVNDKLQFKHSMWDWHKKL